MKRRDMLRKTAAGAAILGFGSTAAHAGKDDRSGTMTLAQASNYDVKKEGAKNPVSTDPITLKGPMEYRPLGKSGVSVSRLGFGSHLTKENMKDPRGRDRQIQEGFENGITLYDVYDHGGFKQFAPMSKSLAGKRKDVVISLVSVENDSRKEVEGALRTFNTDYIDCYRVVYRDGNGDYERGDDVLSLMLKMKEEGKIRAVGVVCHRELGLIDAVKNFPIDYIMMPINFYHNKAWFKDEPDSYSTVMPICREKNIGVLCIKPLGGDPLVAYAQRSGFLSEDYRGPSYPKAAYRYLWQNKDIASVLPSLNSIGQVWEALESLWEPEFTKEDESVLKKLTKKADKTNGAYLPDHYKWMTEWRVKTA